MLIIFPLIFFFVLYPTHIICFHTESCSFLHPPFLLVRHESWKMKALKLKQQKFTTVCSLNCRPLIQLFFGGFFWRVSQLERTPSVKCYLCSWRALGNISYQQAPRSLGHSRGVCPRSDLAGKPLFQSHVSDAAPLAGRSQEAPPSPKLLPIQKHHHRWAGGY